MNNGKLIATRESYGAALADLAKENSNVVVLDADLAGATRTSLMRDVFPDRFIQCGIAEANMMGVAAGLSTMGLVPFVSSFAMFAAGRAFEQIRNSVAYPCLNVKIAATHGGLSVGEDGATHQCCEDIALMRAIPNMIVMCPSDDVEARQMVVSAYKHNGPIYMRFSRAYSPIIHSLSYTFEIGKGELLADGDDIAIIACGIMVAEAMKVRSLLNNKGINVRVINMPTIKPIDEEIIIETARKCKFIFVVEEHSVIGGLGEAVCKLLSEKQPTFVKCIGINDKFGHSGPVIDLLEEYGLCAEKIADQIMVTYAHTKSK